MFPSSLDVPDDKKKIGQTSSAQELSGKMSKTAKEDKLMHSVMEADKDTIKEGKILAESITQGLGSFTPDLMFENLVKDYKLAKKLYGETIIRELTGYDPNFIEKNLTVPEFRRQLKKNIEQQVQKMKEDALLNQEGVVTDEGLLLASLTLYVEELDHLTPKGFGEREFRKISHYGDVSEVVRFNRHRYKDIALKASVKQAIRRGHAEMRPEDLKAKVRHAKGKISVIYAIDASGSMKGEKLKICKKAGIALAFKAIQENNKVGLIVFGSDIKEVVEPTDDFLLLLKKLAAIRAGNETDLAKTIRKAIELFPKRDTKHLVLLTDALPTKGENPIQQTLSAVSAASNEKISISLIGINLDKEGEGLGKKITEQSDGRLYLVKNLQDTDLMVLEDYYSVRG